MKLTKIQISALADKIYSQVSNKIDAENKAFANKDVSHILNVEFKKTLTLKDKPYKSDIEQDIILETIEDIDINTLVDKLVDKYSK